MISHLDTVTVTAFFVGLGFLEILAGSFRKWNQKDITIDLISIAQLALVIKPGIIFFGGKITNFLFPNWTMILSSTPHWIGVFVVLIPGDFMHYWYHRKGHEWKWLWRMHRTHHTSSSMSVTISFRENWQWFLLMPDLWYGSVLVSLGLGEAVVISTLITGVGNVLNHTSISWDKFLYRIPIFRDIIERLIQLPSTHRAHHAVFDPEGKIPMENFGQFFFIWDTIFGTARFPRGIDPTAYGIPNHPQDNWTSQLWWPIFKSDQKNSVYSNRSYFRDGN
jgi:sterol desaturase/sphingolipid hydroxylase (fatty acid hydroxylase superfamily)